MNNRVVDDLRPLVTIDDVGYAALVKRLSSIRPIKELLVFAVGAAIGLWSASLSDLGPGFSWVKLYWYLFSCLVFGLFGLLSYLAVVSTRLPAALLRLPLHINIFETRPFEAIGRQSLVLAMVFIGGIVLSLFFAFQPTNLNKIEFWLIYLSILLIPIAIFFINMRPTHRLLAGEKKKQLDNVQSRIQHSYQIFFQRLDENSEIGELSAQINTLLSYEQRLKETRTWPYNTAMLRTLFFSVLIPLAMVLLRLVFELLM
jgi:hypothetical protein